MTIRKELVAAIIFGLLLGAGVAMGFTYLNNKSAPQNSIGTDLQSPTPTILSTPTNLNLDILFPTNQLYSEEKEITITGKTNPETLVVITGIADEGMVVSDDSGSFSYRTTLTQGANELVVIALKDDARIEKTVVVNYLPPEKK